MKVSTYSVMIKEYGVRPIDDDDMKERERLLMEYKYSVIFEGDFLEFDNAANWVKVELGIDSVAYIFYGKLGYDYGFFEIFFSEEADAIKLTNVLPHMFTRYPVGSVQKSDGYDNYISQSA